MRCLSHCTNEDLLKRIEWCDFAIQLGEKALKEHPDNYYIRYSENIRIYEEQVIKQKCEAILRNRT